MNNLAENLEIINLGGPLAWALAIAAQGLPVFPIYEVAGAGACSCALGTGCPQKQQGKHPRLPNGHKGASLDPNRIRLWWANWPQSNVAIAVPDGLIVVDIDPRNGGFESLDTIESDPARGLPTTRTVVTGGGGAHAYYRVPAGLSFPKNLDGLEHPGIDLKGLGGYVLAPPSNHASGGVYIGAFNEPLAHAPPWLVALGRPRGESRERTARNRAGTTSEHIDHCAVAALLAPYFHPGTRHNFMRELGGYLMNKGATADDAIEIANQLPAPEDGNIEGREQAATWAWGGADKPSGYSGLLALGVPPEFLAQLEPLVSLHSQMVAQVRLLPIEPTPASPTATNDTVSQGGWPMPARNETRSDLGNARRLVRLHGGDLRYCEARTGWYAWDSTRWRYDDTGAAHRAAKASADSLWDHCKNLDEDWRKFAASSLNRNRIEAALKLAQSEPGVPVTVDMLDADPWLLNVQNGTLDLRTGELRQPDRSLLMTKVCATAFTPGARSELWDRFVDTLTAGDRDLAAYLQRAIGYALFGEWREKAFWFGYGDPDGGKSTILGVIGDVLGDYHVSAAASTWMIQHSVGGNRGDITRLLGARLVTTLEIRPGLRFDPEIMKKVTGGDKITAAAKFENEIEFQPRFALWFGANDRPTIPDDDEGFWNRVRCVPFTNVIPRERQDKHLRAKLRSPEHAPAVLAWAVAGCLAWQREGIGSCLAVERATAQYRRDMNRAAGFFDECCELAPTAAVNATVLRARYEAWCRDNGVQRPLQGKAWRGRMLALGATGGDDASRVNGQRTWVGIQLKPD